MAKPKWVVKGGTQRISQDLRLKAEDTRERVFNATETAAEIGEAAMRRQIMTRGTDWRRSHPRNPSPGRIDKGNMLEKVTSTSDKKATSAEAVFGWRQTDAGDYYFIFQEEGFNYIHGANPHFVPGVHALAAGKMRAEEFLRSVFRTLKLRRGAGIRGRGLPNPKYGVE